MRATPQSALIPPLPGDIGYPGGYEERHRGPALWPAPPLLWGSVLIAQREQFEAEYRDALARAASTLDLEPVLTLVQRTWLVRAVMCRNPEMLDGVAADVRRVAAGDESTLADESR